jgi:hypothetical protein
MSTPITAQRNADRPTRSSADDRWMPGGGKPGPVSRLVGAGQRRHSVAHLLLGGLLVLACTCGFLVVWLNAGDRQPVLALARPVTIGHLLAVADLREVDVALDPSVPVVRASQAAGVVGKPMATNLPAGALLTPDAVGRAGVPGAGQALAAVALKPGQVPPEVAPGARVSVVFAPTQEVRAITGSAAVAEPAAVWPAVVTSVASPAGEPVTVVTVQLNETDARQVAAVPAGQLSMLMLPAGDR